MNLIQALLVIMMALAVRGRVTLLDADPHSPTIAEGNADRLSISTRMTIGMAEGKYTPPEEMKRAYWNDLAKAELKKRLQEQSRRKVGKAKNIILFLGDGMSLNTITAARILKGQRQSRTGEEEVLGFEQFPYTGLSKTYCTNAQVPDSACTATAYLTGVKSNIFMTGVTANVNYNNCTASMDPANHLSSLATWSQAAGKSTGFITTTSLTHASPAGAYAHVANRMWESDTDITANAPGVSTATCMDIAQQLVTQPTGSKFDVMLGGGMGKFLPKTLMDSHGNPGERSDGKNLLYKWKCDHPNGVVVTNRTQLLNLDTRTCGPIMGMFQSKHMDYHLLADADYQPTLEELTEVAIKKLRRNRKGYFIFIEGGLIDYGHHATRAALSLDETLEFDKAVMKARAMTNPEDTLIVVTSDHAHPLSISGYPGRGTNILGLNEHDTDDNGISYATLNYAIGPQQYLDAKGDRFLLSAHNMTDPTFIYPSYIKASQGNHGGDDVGVFASGPFEHLFTGSMQQHTIPHMMAYAACIGNGATMCGAQ